jgi:hypothetical protein
MIENYNKKTTVRDIEAYVYDSFGNEIKRIRENTLNGIQIRLKINNLSNLEKPIIEPSHFQPVIIEIIGNKMFINPKLFFYKK